MKRCVNSSSNDLEETTEDVYKRSKKDPDTDGDIQRANVLLKAQELELKLDLQILLDYLTSYEDEVALEIGLVAFFSRILKDKTLFVNLKELKDKGKKSIPDKIPGDSVDDHKDKNEKKFNSNFDSLDKKILLKEYIQYSPECIELISIVERMLKKVRGGGQKFLDGNYRVLVAVLKVISVVIKFNYWPHLFYLKVKLGRRILSQYIGELYELIGQYELTESIANLSCQIILLGSQYARELYQILNFFSKVFIRSMSRESRIHEHLHAIILNFLKVNDESLIEDVLQSKSLSRPLMKGIHLGMINLSRKVLRTFYFDVIMNARVNKMVKVKYFSKSVLRDLTRLVQRRYQYSNPKNNLVELSEMGIRFLRVILTNSVYGIVVPNPPQEWLPMLSTLPVVSNFPTSKINEKFIEIENSVGRNGAFIAVVDNLNPIRSEDQENLLLAIFSQDTFLARHYFDSFDMNLDIELNSIWMSKMEWVINVVGQPQDIGGILSLFNTGKYSFEHIVDWMVPRIVFRCLNSCIQSDHTVVLYTSLSLLVKVFQVINHWCNVIESHGTKSSPMLNQFLEGIILTFRQKLPDFRTVMNLFINIVKVINGGNKLKNDILNPNSPLAIKMHVTIPEVYQSVLSVLNFYLLHFPDMFVTARFDFSRLFHVEFSLMTTEAITTVISIIENSLFKLNWNNIISNNDNDTQLRILMRLSTQIPFEIQPKARKIFQSILKKSKLFLHAHDEIHLWINRLTYQPKVLLYFENALKLLSLNMKKLMEIVDQIVLKKLTKYSKKLNITTRHYITTPNNSIKDNNGYINDSSTPKSELPFSYLVPCILFYHDELCNEFENDDRQQVLSYVIATLLDILYSQIDPLPFVLIIAKNKYICKDSGIRNFVRYVRGLFGLSSENLKMKIHSKNLLDANQAAHLNVQISLWDSFDLIQNFGGIEALNLKNLLIHFFSSKYKSQLVQQTKLKHLIAKKLCEPSSNNMHGIFWSIKIIIFHLSIRIEKSEYNDLIFEVLEQILHKITWQSTNMHHNIIKFVSHHPTIIKHFLDNNTISKKIARILSILFTIPVKSLTTPYFDKILNQLQSHKNLIYIIENLVIIMKIFDSNKLNEIIITILDNYEEEILSAEYKDIVLEHLFMITNECLKPICDPKSLPLWIKPILYKTDVNGLVTARVISGKCLVRFAEIRSKLDCNYRQLIDCLIFENLLMSIYCKNSGLSEIGSDLPILIFDQVNSLFSSLPLTIYGISSILLCYEATIGKLDISNTKDLFNYNFNFCDYNEKLLLHGNGIEGFEEICEYLPSLIAIFMLLEGGVGEVSVYFEVFSFIVAICVVTSDGSVDGGGSVMEMGLELVKQYGIPILVRLLKEGRWEFDERRKSFLLDKMNALIGREVLMTVPQWVLFCTIVKQKSIRINIFLKQICFLIEKKSGEYSKDNFLDFNILKEEVENIFTGYDGDDDDDGGVLVYDMMKSMLKGGFLICEVMDCCARVVRVYGGGMSVDELRRLHDMVILHSNFVMALMDESGVDGGVRAGLIDLMYGIYSELVQKKGSESLFTWKLLSFYLSIYEASLSVIDQKLLLIIHCFEMNGVGISECGFLWGSNFRKHFFDNVVDEKLTELLMMNGKLFSLEKVNNTIDLFPIDISAHEWRVLDTIDVWKDANNRKNKSELDSIYDLRFVIPYIYLAINNLNIDFRRLLHTGIHSLVFFALSCSCNSLRKFSYDVLIRFFELLGKNYECLLTKFVIKILREKNKNCARLSGLQVSLLSRMVSILMRSNHILSKLISEYLSSGSTLNLELENLWKRIMSLSTSTPRSAREWLFKSMALGLNVDGNLNALSPWMITSLYQLLSSTIISDYSSFLERAKIWKLISGILKFDGKIEYSHTLKQSLLSFLVGWTNSFHSRFSSYDVSLVYTASANSIQVFSEYRFIYRQLSEIVWTDNMEIYWPQVYQIVSNTVFYLESQTLQFMPSVHTATTTLNEKLAPLQDLLISTIRALSNFPTRLFRPPPSLLKTLRNQLSILITQKNFNIILNSSSYENQFFNTSFEKFLLEMEFLLVKIISNCQWNERGDEELSMGKEMFEFALERLLVVYDGGLESNVVLFNLIDSIRGFLVDIGGNRSEYARMVGALAYFYRRTWEMAIVMSLNNLFVSILSRDEEARLLVELDQMSDSVPIVKMFRYCSNEEIDDTIAKRHLTLSKKLRLILLDPSRF